MWVQREFRNNFIFTKLSFTASGTERAIPVPCSSHKVGNSKHEGNKHRQDDSGVDFYQSQPQSMFLGTGTTAIKVS